eukprot:2506715-Pleurochrysis_carterae.AAC.1
MRSLLPRLHDGRDAVLGHWYQVEPRERDARAAARADAAREERRRHVRQELPLRIRSRRALTRTAIDNSDCTPHATAAAAAIVATVAIATSSPLRAYGRERERARRHERRAERRGGHVDGTARRAQQPARWREVGARETRRRQVDLRNRGRLVARVRVGRLLLSV